MLKIKRFEICHWVQEVGDCAVLQLWYVKEVGYS
jgi:hypothetical protein